MQSCSSDGISRVRVRTECENLARALSVAVSRNVHKNGDATVYYWLVDWVAATDEIYYSRHVIGFNTIGEDFL